MDIIYWNFATFYKRFNSTQVKWQLIFSIKNIEYKLPHKLPNDVKLKILRTQ